MDEGKLPLSSDELTSRPASDGKPTVVDATLADSARSDQPVALGRQRHPDLSELCRNDLPDGPSVLVYCGSAEEVSQGFLIALCAMGVAMAEHTPEPEMPAVARAKP
jgi:hypothetical protein